MNKTILAGLALAFGACACAKQAPTTAVQTLGAAQRAQPNPAQFFEKTEAHSEEDLATAGSQLLRAGSSIGLSQAERCLSEEKGRKAIQSLCLLLWAGGESGESSRVSQAVLDGAPNSPALATALALRPRLLRGTTATQLKSYLQALERQPVWLKVQLAEGWEAENGSLLSQDPTGISPFLEGNGHLSPESTRASALYLNRSDPKQYDALVNANCRSGSSAQANLACFRLAASLIGGNSTAENLAASLFVYLGDEKSESGTLFQKNFPKHARALKAFYQKERK